MKGSRNWKNPCDIQGCSCITRGQDEFPTYFLALDQSVSLLFLSVCLEYQKLSFGRLWDSSENPAISLNNCKEAKKKNSQPITDQNFTA
jgi:hypothetical protein